MHRIALLVFALLPAVAHAEVLDKEFSLLVVASWALFGTLASFLAARYRPWLLAVVLPAVALFFGIHLSEFVEPFVGRALVAEAGTTYVLVSWAGPFTVLVGCALGLAARVRHGKVGA